MRTSDGASDAKLVPVVLGDAESGGNPLGEGLRIDVRARSPPDKRS